VSWSGKLTQTSLFSLRSSPAKFKHDGHEYVWNRRKVMDIPTERKGEDEDGMFVVSTVP
jgi:hypothetical protein